MKFVSLFSKRLLDKSQKSKFALSKKDFTDDIKAPTS